MDLDRSNSFNHQLLSKDLIFELLSELNDRLKQEELVITMNIYGGAVMCFVYNARVSTKDIDAVFSNGKRVYDLSREIARARNIDSEWLNDDIHLIESYIKKQDLKKLEMFTNITIYVPTAEQMLAMKLYASRGKPFKDEDDIKFLINHLSIKTIDDLFRILYKFIPKEKIKDNTVDMINKITKELKLKTSIFRRLFRGNR